VCVCIYIYIYIYDIYVVDDLEFHKSILMAILIAPNEFNHCLDLINILHV
jgi:hypothetical protein